VGHHERKCLFVRWAHNHALHAAHAWLLYSPACYAACNQTKQALRQLPLTPHRTPATPAPAPQLEQLLSLRSCPHCGEGLELDQGVDLLTATCPHPRCGRRLHVEDAAAEQAFRRYSKQQRYRECPSCGATVERMHGCNHMKCRCVLAGWPAGGAVRLVTMQCMQQGLHRGCCKRAAWLVVLPQVLVGCHAVPCRMMHEGTLLMHLDLHSTGMACHLQVQHPLLLCVWPGPHPAGSAPLLSLCRRRMQGLRLITSPARRAGR